SLLSKRKKDSRPCTQALCKFRRVLRALPDRGRIQMSYRILKTNVLASVLALSVLSVACENAPTAPDPTPTPTPVVELNYTISGAVTEMTETGLVPVHGARVMVFSTVQSAITDANGFYSIPGVRVRTGLLTVTKDGYVPLNA